MPIPLLWVIGSSALGFGAGWFTSNRNTLLVIAAVGVGAYVYVNKK